MKTMYVFISIWIFFLLIPTSSFAMDNTQVVNIQSVTIAPYNYSSSISVSATVYGSVTSSVYSNLGSYSVSGAVYGVELDKINMELSKDITMVNLSTVRKDPTSNGTMELAMKSKVTSIRVVSTTNLGNNLYSAKIQVRVHIPKTSYVEELSDDNSRYRLHQRVGLYSGLYTVRLVT